MVFRLNGWDNPQGIEALERTEQIVKQVYWDQSAKEKDL